MPLAPQPPASCAARRVPRVPIGSWAPDQRCVLGNGADKSSRSTVRCAQRTRHGPLRRACETSSRTKHHVCHVRFHDQHDTCAGLYIFFAYLLRWLPLLIYGACDNINMPRLGLGIFGSIFFAIGGSGAPQRRLGMARLCTSHVVRGMSQVAVSVQLARSCSSSTRRKPTCSAAPRSTTKSRPTRRPPHRRGTRASSSPTRRR